MSLVRLPDVDEKVTHGIVTSAIEVHRTLGPGLLESTYRTCLIHELTSHGLRTCCEVSIPVRYKGLSIETSYRADIIVEDSVLLELKAVERPLPIHEAQLLTYPKLSNLRVGFLMNFNVTRMQLGLRRYLR
jgi:GxxExxY protein